MIYCELFVRTCNNFPKIAENERFFENLILPYFLKKSYTRKNDYVVKEY